MRRWLAVPLLIAALAGCGDSPTEPGGGRWSYSDGKDNISGRPYAHASLSSYPMTLYVRCREGGLSVYVATNFITESGSVRYRIDAGAARSESWGEATDFKALFYRGDARAFAQQLARSKELVFEAREYAGRAREATFRLDGLDVHLPTILAACS